MEPEMTEFQWNSLHLHRNFKDSKKVSESCFVDCTGVAPEEKVMNETEEIEAAIAKLRAELESAKTIWQHWEPYACLFVGMVIGIVLAHFVR